MAGLFCHDDHRIQGGTVIQVDNLTKYYDSFCAVDGISLEIRKGEILGLLGPNGAGKTTTLRMLTGFFRPTSGTIKINELEICKEFIETAIKQYGRTPISLIYLGKYYSRSEHYKKAKEAFQEAIVKDEKLVDGYIDLSVIESEVYDNNHKALQYLEKVLSFHPNNILLLNNYTYFHNFSFKCFNVNANRLTCTSRLYISL